MSSPAVVEPEKGTSFSYEFMMSPDFEVHLLPMDDCESLTNHIGTLFDGTVAGGCEAVDVDPETARRFIREILTQYRDTPYHNCFHAFCVVRETAFLFNSTGGLGVRSAKGLFVLLLSAVIHDVDHPGTNNDYEVKTGSHLAQVYDNKSVLENHHIDLAFAIMKQESFNVFSRWSQEERERAYNVIGQAVLATDMSFHGDMTKSLEVRGATGRFDFSSPVDRIDFIKYIVHAADIFNAARKFPTAARIAEQVVAEFQHQVQLERARGLDVAPFMVIEDEAALCKGEAGFAKFVARPYFAALAACFPGNEALRGIVCQIDANVECWQKRGEGRAL